MGNEINILDLEQLVLDENSSKKLKFQTETVYQFIVGNQHFNMRKLSIPNAFHISKPDRSNMDDAQVREFIDLYFDECLQYINDDNSKNLVDFYEYTSQLNKDKTEVIVHAFNPRRVDKSQGKAESSKISGLFKEKRRR